MQQAPAAGWAGMPEVRAAKRVRSAGGDDAAVRRVLTFTAAMDRTRDADALWLSAARLYDHEPWVFDAESVVAQPSDARTLLREHNVSQRHGPDAAAWLAIASSLREPSVVRDAI